MLVFCGLALVAAGASLAMVGISREHVRAVRSLVWVMAALAGIHLLLGAPLLAAVQLFVGVGSVLGLALAATSRLETGPEFTTRTLSEALPKTLIVIAVFGFAIMFAIIFSEYSSFVASSYGISLRSVLTLSTTLFALGAVGVLVRRNVVIMLLSIDLTLNAGVLALVAFGAHTLALVGLVLALAELGAGLLVITVWVPHRRSLDVDDASALEW